MYKNIPYVIVNRSLIRAGTLRQEFFVTQQTAVVAYPADFIQGRKHPEAVSLVATFPKEAMGLTQGQVRALQGAYGGTLSVKFENQELVVVRTVLPKSGDELAHHAKVLARNISAHLGFKTLVREEMVVT